MWSGAELSMLIRGRDESAAAFTAARKGLEGFGAAASSVARSTNASLGTMSAAARSTAGGFTAVASVSRSAVTGFGAVSLAARTAGSHMTALAGATRSAASTMQAEIAKLGRAATAATAAATAALTAGIGASVKQAADFEKTISGVAAVSGASAAQIKDLSALALKLGADTSFSATEAAQGIEELVKAGVSMGDVMGGAAKASLDLAAAGGVSVAESATIASNAMNAFGIKGAEMGRIADLIAGAANASAIDVHEFGFALQASGAVAATVGMTFDDLSVAIAEMGQAGIKGSDAGTSLKTFLMGLQPQTKEQTKLFRELGLMTKDGANKFFDARGKLKSLAEVQGILQESMKGMTDQQRLATMETLFGSDAVRAAAVLTKSGASGFAEMAAAMGKVTAADVAEKRLDNLSGSVEKFKGSLSTAAITIGTGFLPSLKRIVDGATATLNAWMPAIAAFSERIPGAMDALISKALQLGPVVQRVFTDMGQIVGAFVGLELDDYAAGWDTWIGTLVRAKEIGVGAVSGLIDAVSLLINLDPGAYAGAWDTVRGVFTQVVGVARTAIAGVVAAVQAGLPVIRAAFDTLLPVVLAVGQAFIDNIAATIQFVTGRVIPPLMSIIQQTAGFFLGTLQPAMASTAGVIRGILGDTLDWLAGTVWPPLLAIAQMTVSFWTGRLLPAIATVAGPLRTVLGESIQWLADVGWPALLAAAGTVVNFFVTKIVPMLPSLAQTIRTVLGAAITWVANVGWPAFLAAAATVSTFITGTVVPAVSKIVEWLGQKIPPVLNWLTTTGWPTLVSAAETVSAWINETGIPAFTKLVDWLGPKVSAVAKWLIDTGWPQLKEAGQTVSDWIDQKALPALKDLAEWLGPKVSDAIKWLYETGWPELKRTGDLVVKMFEDTVKWARDVWEQIKEKGVWDDLREAFDKLWNAGKILVETFWPQMKDGAAQAFTPTDVFVALIKGASGFLLAFATGVEAIAKALQALKEQAEKLPDWLVNGLKGGGLPALGPAGGVLAPLLPGGSGQGSGSASGGGANFGAIDNSSRQAFVRSAYPYMLQAAGGNKDLAEMMLAKAISENGDVGKGGEFIGNNFSGIKGKGDAGSFTARTWEWENGQRVYKDQEFAAYSTPQKGMEAFLQFLKDNSRYSGALSNFGQSGNAPQLFRDINRAGYATDPNWAATVENIRDTQVRPITKDLPAVVQMSQAVDTLGASAARMGENVNTAGGSVSTLTGLAGDNQRALLFVIDTLAQQRFLLDATGQANTALAVDMIPVINLLEQQGTISAASALMLREQAQAIIDSGAAGVSAQAGIDTITTSTKGLASAADMAAQKAAEMAARASAIGRASESASDQVSDLADSLGELPSWFTPSGKTVDAIFKPDKRATGGPVSAGVPYLVGERGPELFVPGGGGRILPSGSFGGGSQTVVNVTVQGSLIHERELEQVVLSAMGGGMRRGVSLGVR